MDWDKEIRSSCLLGARAQTMGCPMLSRDAFCITSLIASANSRSSRFANTSNRASWPPIEAAAIARLEAFLCATLGSIPSLLQESHICLKAPSFDFLDLETAVFKSRSSLTRHHCRGALSRRAPRSTNRGAHCCFPTIISMCYIKKDLGVEYDAPPSNTGKIEYHQGLLYVPFKHLKSRWIIIVVANPPKRDMNLAGSRKFLVLIVLTLEKSTSLEGVPAVYIKW